MNRRSWMATAIGIGIGIAAAARTRRLAPLAPEASEGLVRPDHLASALSPTSVSHVYLLEAGEAGYLCAN